MLPAKPTLPDPTPILVELRSMQVSEENYGEICEAVIETKAQYKRLDEEEHKITDPINEALKAARSWFAAPKKAYVEIERILKEKIIEHQEALRTKKAEAVAQITQGSVDARHTLADLAKPPHPPAIQMREVWDLEIVDRSQVPPMFWTIDESALRKYAGKCDVPGVRFFKRPVVAVGTTPPVR